mmetsp:Transcript_41297/g.95083  ORF Transcript_41297/g.95083 Transcript_41297/m.95083 type:complete len:137 (-) Transcript_41297:28-438(-)
MFAALRSKSKDLAGHSDAHDEAKPTRSSSKGRQGSKGHVHTVDQLQRKIASAEEEIKHHLQHRCKHSAVHAIKKKKMYEKELAGLLEEQGLSNPEGEHKDIDHENEEHLEAEYVRRMSIAHPGLDPNAEADAQGSS